jgi:hypothetical protein
MNSAAHLAASVGKQPIDGRRTTSAELSPFVHIARDFRRAEAAEGHPLPAGGWVLVFRGAAVGWSAEMPDPHRHIPGVVAVGAAGECLRAAEGDSWNGAERWEPLYQEAAR